MLKTILRFYSYLYHLILGLFLFIIGAFGLLGSNKTLQMPLLPWDDPTLTYVVFFGSLAGLISLVLAVTGKLRLPFRLWTIVVFVLMFRGYFLTGYYLGGVLLNAVLLTLGALLAVYGSWTGARRKHA